MEIAQAAEQRGVDLGAEPAASPFTQVKIFWSGTSSQASYSSRSASLNFAICGVGEAAEHQIHLADAAMPGAEQQPPPARVQSFARNRQFRSSSRSNAKNPDGAGRGLYRGLAGRCQRLLCTAQHCVRRTRKPACRPCARSCSTPCSPRSPACPASGRSWRSSMPGCSTARRRAWSTCCFICRPASSTGGRGRSSTRCSPARSSPSR